MMTPTVSAHRHALADPATSRLWRVPSEALGALRDLVACQSNPNRAGGPEARYHASRVIRASRRTLGAWTDRYSARMSRAWVSHHVDTMGALILSGVVPGRIAKGGGYVDEHGDPWYDIDRIFG